MSSRGTLYVGTSGYQYDHWRGPFYPHGIPKSAWLEHYARHFQCVEINATFYRLPSDAVFDRWRDAVPSEFRFALKYSRYATHMKKLKDPEDALGQFLPSAKRLGRRLGPILVQLPPRWPRNLERLRRFLAAIPRAQRWAIELRDESWLHEEVYSELSAHGAALVRHDIIRGHPWVETTNFIYLRFHGNHYRGGYSAQALGAQARRLSDCLERGLDVWAFFNNDEAGHAVRNALALRRYVTGV